jgi:hypothetical protein
MVLAATTGRISRGRFAERNYPRGQSDQKWYNVSMRFTWVPLIALLAGSGLVWADETAKNPAPQATAEQIGNWVAELDSNLFDDRERAQKNLIQSKMIGLDAVAEAARNGSLECATRAINILLAWSEAEDHELVLAALEKLSTMDSHPKQSLLAKTCRSKASKSSVAPTS